MGISATFIIVKFENKKKMYVNYFYYCFREETSVNCSFAYDSKLKIALCGSDPNRNEGI